MTTAAVVLTTVAVIVMLVKVELVRRLWPIVRVVRLVWLVGIVVVRARLVIRHVNYSRLLGIRVINHGPSSLCLSYPHYSHSCKQSQGEKFIHFVL